MANVKLSAIAAGTTPTPTDTVIGVQSGTTDSQYTLAQIGASILKTGNPVVGGTPGSILFIDGSGNLAQDNTNLFWDDTNFYLKLGHAGTTAKLYLNNVPAIYEVPNASGNNWFEGNAGNFTVTGAANFGTGDGALAIVTSGAYNTAVGTSALAGVTIGFQNFGLGYQAGTNLSSGHDNTAIGFAALGTATTDSSNLAIGTQALQFQNLSAGLNVAIGTNAGLSVTTGGSNIIVGASGGPTTGASNVQIGHHQASLIHSGSYNVLIGESVAAGGRIQDGNYNTIIGLFCGYNFGANSSGNVVLGSWRGPSATVTNIFAVSDGSAKEMMDYNYLSSNTLSVYQFDSQGSGLSSPSAIHIYNKMDNLYSLTNYERARLDWNLTSNVFRLASQAGGTGTTRLIAIDGFSKAGAPANTDLPSGTFALIDDTTNNQTWLVFNKGGTIRKVQLT